MQYLVFSTFGFLQESRIPGTFVWGSLRSAKVFKTQARALKKCDQLRKHKIECSSCGKGVGNWI